MREKNRINLLRYFYWSFNNLLLKAALVNNSIQITKNKGGIKVGKEQSNL